MKITRKDFLRLSGLSLLAAGCKQAVRFANQPASAARAASAQPVRWGMVIDLRKCREKDGCNACVHACNAAHNIPQIANRAHEVKWLWTEPYATVFPSAQTGYAPQTVAETTVPLLCNHCADPPCTRVCPTQATWKRDDGIVMMDWHRCIGCRYCVAACPYGSRSFNWEDPRPSIASINPDFPTRTKGVVEKCNFCEERLARGLKPACVDACPQRVFTFGNLADPNSEPRQMLRERFAVQREPELGTGPSVFYLV
ncbi:MAG TPA: 4Fe-4S dicluster domain-containing protein [Terracidiphilus sp.]|nr:4Fe-4S dicluster domain-containing protein [Terracidiphilus sp.]